MNQKIDSVKKFVREHKTALVAVAIATTALALQHRTSKLHNEFLIEHDLYEEFYGFPYES